MSASSTSAIIDDLSHGHDDKVLAWSKKLKEYFQVSRTSHFVNGNLNEVYS